MSRRFTLPPFSTRPTRPIEQTRHSSSATHEKSLSPQGKNKQAMKLLVIGGGGREHALAWRLARAPRVQTVFVAPGNGGTATAQNIQNVNLSTNEELVAFAQKEKIAFTVVGPEA